MSALEYNDPLLINRRKGTSDDPYINMERSYLIKENVVILDEIPDKFERVIVKNGDQHLIEIQSGAPKENQFRVSYLFGVVFFHPSANGLNVDILYKGTGLSLIPASRVYYLDGTDVVKDLQTLINFGKDSIKNLELLEQRIREAEEATTNAIEAANNASQSSDLALQSAENADMATERANQSADNADEKALLVQDKIDEINNRMSQIDLDYESSKEQWDTQVQTKVHEVDDKLEEAETRISGIESDYADISHDYYDVLKPDLLQILTLVYHNISDDWK